MAIDNRSTETIIVQPYVSTLRYEMMKFNNDLLQNLEYNRNIKFMFKKTPTDTFEPSELKNSLDKSKDIFVTTKNIDIQYVNDFTKNILEKGIFYYLLKNRFHELYYSVSTIDNATQVLSNILLPTNKKPISELAATILPHASEESNLAEQSKNKASILLEQKQSEFDNAVPDKKNEKKKELDIQKTKMEEAEEALKEANNNIIKQ